MSFDLTRVKLKDIVSTFHLANYPTMEENFQGRTITDIEKVVDPFVFIEWTCKEVTYGMPMINYAIKGELLLRHYARNNSGLKIFSEYSSLLGVYLSRELLDGVRFGDIKSYPDASKPGFDGFTNVIKYEVQYSR